MPGPYFQRERWPAFAYLGNSYSFDHLNEFQFTSADSDGVDRVIAVTFTHHCFTRKPDGALNQALCYPPHGVGSREFCFDRYSLSCNLLNRVVAVTSGKVWMAEDRNFVVADVIDHSGTLVHYVYHAPCEVASR